MLEFLKRQPPKPSPTPDHGYVIFQYEGFVVCSSPLFNLVLLSLSASDADLHAQLTTLLGMQAAE